MKLLGQFLQYFTGMFLGWSSFRFLKIMTPGPKMPRPRAYQFFHRKILKNLLLRNYLANFYNISQECSMVGPLSDS